jgi:excisionase family DNA binding protein
VESNAATAEQPEYLTVEEAAKHFRVSLPTIYRRCADGTLPHVRIGSAGPIRIPLAVLEHLENPVERRAPDFSAVEAQAPGGEAA